MAKTMAVVLCILLGGVIGCKSQPAMSTGPTTGEWKEPKWVAQPYAAFPEDAGKAFYAVGIAEKKKIPDVYLLRKAANTRGREELAAQLRTMVQAVMKDYTEAAFTGSMDQGQIQSLTSNVAKSIIDETLIGSTQVDTWEHPKTGDIYVLVRMSMDGVAKQMRDKIIEVEKDRLRVDAAKAHQELDQIIEKNRQHLK